MMPMSGLLSIFAVEARDYKNLQFDEAAASMATTIIYALCIGIFIAALYAAYQRGVVGKPVRALLATEALSPEQAKTLAELGLDKNPFILFEIDRNTMLGRFIKRVEPQDDGELPRYYIPEELKYDADVRFEAKGNGVAALVITAIVSVVLAFALNALLPGFLTIIDNLM